MSNEPHDPFTDLAAALAIAPRPEFAAEVRSQVGQVRPGVTWVSWFALGAAAAVMAFAVWIGIPRLGEPDRQPSVTTLVPARPQPAAVAAVRQPALGSQVVRTRTNPAVRRVSREASGDREPEVLISPDRKIAFEQLKAALAGGRLDESTLPPEVMDVTTSTGWPSSAPEDSEAPRRDRFQHLELPPNYLGHTRSTDS